nr:MAG TPA: hypothetical protein [Caudoviricetes sp.]
MRATTRARSVRRTTRIVVRRYILMMFAEILRTC